MTDTKKHEEKKGINPVAAAAAGAVVGAGLAAGAVALSDEKNRKKVQHALETAKGKAQEYMDKVQKELNEKKKEVGEKLAETKEEATKAVDSSKKTLHNVSSGANR